GDGIVVRAGSLNGERDGGDVRDDGGVAHGLRRRIVGVLAPAALAVGLVVSLRRELDGAFDERREEVHGTDGELDGEGSIVSTAVPPAQTSMTWRVVVSRSHALSHSARSAGPDVFRDERTAKARSCSVPAG